MKKVILPLLAIVATFTITACSKKGMSEEMKTKMQTFETDWKTTGEEMKTMETEMNTRMDEMKKMHADAMGGHDMGDMKHEDMKGDSKEMPHDDMHAGMEQCSMIDQRIADFKAKCDAAMASWEADTQSYNEWKEKVKKGEVEEEAAMTEMKAWEEKLANYKTGGMAMSQEMNTLYTDVKAHADADMQMMMK